MMKNTSIKKRVTLYYSLVLVLITVLTLGVFMVTARFQTDIISKDTVMKAVQNGFDEIETVGDTLQVDNDFDSFHKGVSLLIYDENGEIVKGSAPARFPSSIPLSAGDFDELVTEEDTWLVYDLYNTYENGQGIWIRGIFALDNGVATLNSILKIMFIALPILLLLAIIAGQRITKKAFEPVAEITAAANSINGGKDLSKRLPQGENHDELYYLTETLNQMIDRLEAAFIAEKEFASDVSHELKTPIAVILADCEYILKENRTIEEYKESMETIEQQCKRTMSMIQQLLQVSRTIDKDKVLDREDFDLSEMMNGIADELEKVAKENDITLLRKIQPKVMINGDETLIMRMIINLITNAIKYSSPDKESWIKVSMGSGADGQIHLSVEDNGIGISEENQVNIFNRFYKVDKSRTSEANSFGLGLSMVKWIAEAHSGTITVESHLGQGSTFDVLL
ncbi:signal transduction histidine kinase [Clostridiales Family XIII bacterium PM5-7]